MRRLRRCARRGPTARRGSSTTAALDVAPRLELAEPADGVRVFPETGYVVRAARRGSALAFDCGPVVAAVPAGARARRRAVVPALAGRASRSSSIRACRRTRPGDERDFFRSTQAHSTVAVGGSQFESWGAFRAGPLPQCRAGRAGEDGAVRPSRHRARRARASDPDRADAVVVEDETSGADAVSTLVLARDADVDAATSSRRARAACARGEARRAPAGAVRSCSAARPRRSWRIRTR